METKNETTQIKNILQSKKFKKIICALCIIIGILVVFQAGMMVGYHKAGSSYRFGENYYREFEGHHPKMIGMPGENFPDAHGAIGKIVSITLPTIVIADPNNIEKVVLLKDETLIRHFRETINAANLKADDFIVVIGTPNEQGEIEAKLIRLLPPPPPGFPQNEVNAATVTPPTK